MKKQILLLALFIVPSLINAAQQMTNDDDFCGIEIEYSVQDLLNEGNLKPNIVINQHGTTSINLSDIGLTSLKGLENIPGAKEATTLNCSNNNITDIENIFNKKLFPKLGYISLSDNNIATISPQAFTKCENLRFINLKNNRLTTINGIFNDKNLSILDNINLENNLINHIDSTTFRGIPMLKSINLKGNKINTLKDFLRMPHLHKKLPKENEYSKDEIIFITLNENPLSDSDEDAIEAFKLNNHLSMIITNREKEKKEKEAQIKREEAFLKNAEAAKYELEHPNKAWFKKIFGSK